MLDIYFSEFESLLKEVEGLIFTKSSQQLDTQALQDASKKIQQLKNTLSSIEFDYRSKSPSERTKLKPLIDEAKAKFHGIEKSWLFASSKNSPKDIEEANSSSQATSQLIYGSKKLDQSLQVAESTEKITQDILLDLHRQRETIYRVKLNTQKASNNINDNDTIINKMSVWWKRYF